MSDTVFVIQKHWPERPTLELPEHFDVRIRNEDGFVYQWVMFEDPRGATTAAAIRKEGGDDVFLSSDAELSNLVEWAKKELEDAGWFEDGEDSLYGDMLGKAVLDMMKVFSAQGHSGMSASLALALFKNLAAWKPLSPLTADPAEWEDVSEMMGRPCWQNKRDHSKFSYDEGKTWRDCNEQSDQLQTMWADEDQDEHGLVIELEPKSTMNPSGAKAFLQTVFEGEARKIEEGQDRVAFVLADMKVFEARRVDGELWEVRFTDVKERQMAAADAKLITVPVAKYDAAKMDNRVLGDDFRVVMAWWATLKAGKKIEKTEDEMRGYARKIVAELVNRGKVTFNAARMKATSRALLGETLWELHGKGGKGIYLVPPHAQMLVEGRKRMKLAKRAWDIDPARFYGILDGKGVVGMARFEKREEIDEAAFDRLKNEHRVTRDEMEAWGWEFPLQGWRVRDVVKFDEPRKFKLPRGAQKFVNLTMVRLQNLPEGVKKKGIEGVADVVPEKLKELTKTELVLVMAWLQGEFEYGRRRGLEPENIVNAAAFVRAEEEERGMEIRTETPLDFAVKRLRGKLDAELHDIKGGRRVLLKDVLPYLKSFDLSKPNVYLVGSLAIEGRGHDIDIVVRGKPDRVLEFRMSRMLPPHLRDKLRFVYDCEGPFSVDGSRCVPIRRGDLIDLVPLCELYEIAQRSPIQRLFGPVSFDVLDTESLDWYTIGRKDNETKWVKVKKIIRHPFCGTMKWVEQKRGNTVLTPNHSLYNEKGELTLPDLRDPIMALRDVPKVECGGSPIELAVPGAEQLPNGFLAWHHVGKGSRNIGWNSFPRTFLGRYEQGSSELRALLRFLAAYITEGSATQRTKKDGCCERHTCISNSDTGYLEEVKRAYETISNGTACSICTPKRKKPGAVSRLTISNRIAYEVCVALCGKGSHEKRIPSFVFSLPESDQAFFKEELIRGDGCTRRRHKKRELRYTTSSLRLLSGLSLMSAINGWLFNMRRNRSIEREYSVFELNWVNREIRQGKRTVTDLPLEEPRYVYDLETESGNFVDGAGLVLVHNTSNIPLYAKRMERIGSEVVSMSSDAELQKGPSPEVERQAQKAKREDKITFGEYFLTMKPLRGAYGEDRQTVENFMGLFDENDFPRLSSKKYDGMNVEVHATADRAKIISEDGEVYPAGSLPEVEAAFKDLVKKSKASNAVFLAELESWRGKIHEPREAVSGLVKKHDDASVVANVYAVVYSDGEDLHGETEERRREILEDMFDWPQSTEGAPDVGKKLNLVPERPSKNKGELEETVRKLSKLPASEGVVSKKADSKYRLTGTSVGRDWVKFHKSQSAVSEVVKREATRAKGAPYKYVYGLRYDKKKWEPNRKAIKGVAEDDEAWDRLIVLGRSFNWDEKLEKGDRFEIEFETMNVTENADGTVDMSFWVPRPMKVGGRLETVDDAIAKAKREGILQRKKVTEEGESVYLSDGEPPHGGGAGGTPSPDPSPDSTLQRLVKQPPMPESARKDMSKWRGVSRAALAKIDPKKLPKGFFALESHFRGKTVHLDFRRKEDGYLRGFTILNQVAGSIKEDVDTLGEAKAWDGKFDDADVNKFRPGMDPQKKVGAVVKGQQPLEWVTMVNRVVEPGTVGGSKEHEGVFYGTDWGLLWPGVQKPWFEEFFLYGRRFDGKRVVFRLVELEGAKGLEPGLNTLTWVAKDEVPYLLSRRGRVEKREDAPPDGTSWIPPNWEAAIKPELRWWEKKGLSKEKKMDLMDAAYDQMIEDGYLAGRKIGAEKEEAEEAESLHALEMFAARREKYAHLVGINLADPKFALTVHRWKGPEVVRGVWNVRRLLHLGEKTWELKGDPLREDVVVATVAKMDVNPPKGTWLTFSGEIEPGKLKPVPPYPKTLPVYVDIVDAGDADVIEETDEFIHVDFKGKEVKGRWAFRAEEPGANIWRFGKLEYNVRRQPM